MAELSPKANGAAVSHLIDVDAAPADASTPAPLVPQHPRPFAAANAAPRCTAHAKTGQRCKKPAIKGATVCMQHGGSAPQVREAARLRLALLVTPSLQGLHEIVKDKSHPQRLSAIKEVLERSQLYAHGVDAPAGRGFNPAITVQTQVNMPDARVASMSDEELDTYQKLLMELRELLPAEEPKRIGTVSRG